MTDNKKISISQAFWYFVFFSVVGLLVETTYGYITTGILESRKGLLIGPFCPVYGIGAAILIISTYRLEKSPIKIFIVGAIVGGFVEYIISYCLEAIYGIRFWEYSYLLFNLNGRICILYSIFWGILSILLIKWIKPLIDKIINKIPAKKGIEIALLVFLIIDALVTVWAINTYQNRVVYEKTNSNNNIIKQIEEKAFSNEVMVKNFPNLRYITKDGEEVFIKDLL